MKTLIIKEGLKKLNKALKERFIPEDTLTGLPLTLEEKILVGRYKFKWNKWLPEKIPNGELTKNAMPFYFHVLLEANRVKRNNKNFYYYNNFCKELNAYTDIFLRKWVERYKLERTSSGRNIDNDFWRPLILAACGIKCNFKKGRVTLKQVFYLSNPIPNLIFFQEQITADCPFDNHTSFFNRLDTVFSTDYRYRCGAFLGNWEKAINKNPRYLALKKADEEKEALDKERKEKERLDKLGEVLKNFVADRRVGYDFINFIREHKSTDSFKEKMMIREAFDKTILCEVQDKFFPGQNLSPKSNEFIAALAAAYGTYALAITL